MRFLNGTALDNRRAVEDVWIAVDDRCRARHDHLFPEIVAPTPNTSHGTSENQPVPAHPIDPTEADAATHFCVSFFPVVCLVGSVFAFKSASASDGSRRSPARTRVQSAAAPNRRGAARRFADRP